MFLGLDEKPQLVDSLGSVHTQPSVSHNGHISEYEAVGGWPPLGVAGYLLSEHFHHPALLIMPLITRYACICLPLYRPEGVIPRHSRQL